MKILLLILLVLPWTSGQEPRINADRLYPRTEFQGGAVVIDNGARRLVVVDDVSKLYVEVSSQPGPTPGPCMERIVPQYGAPRVAIHADALYFCIARDGQNFRWVKVPYLTAW